MLKNNIKKMLTINKSDLAIKKAILQAIIVITILSTSMLFNRFDLGLTAVLGSYSHVYIIKGPYPSRIRKVFVISIMLSLSIMLGTLTIPFPILYATMLGILGTLSHFTFKALQTPGPSSLFFILTFSIASIMPIEPSEFLFRGLLVFLGGLVSVIVVMIDAYFNHNKPEKTSVINVYENLIILVQNFGEDGFNEARVNTLNAINNATTTLITANAFWNKNNNYNRLILLKKSADGIWSACLELSSRGYKRLPDEVLTSLKYIHQQLLGNHNIVYKANYYTGNDPYILRLLDKIYDVEEYLNIDDVQVNKKYKYRKPTYLHAIRDNLKVDSLVFMSSVKYGIILFASVIIAFGIGFERAYWIPMSCCSVLLGPTYLSTIERAIQRTIGTVIGMLFAILILYLEPSQWMIMFLMTLFLSIVEMVIVSNYTLAVMLITPNVLLMSSAITQRFDMTLLAPRLTDVIIGSGIGLIGVLIVGRKQASKKLPIAICRALRVQSVAFYTMFSSNQYKNNQYKEKVIDQMQTEITNTKAMYQAALNEIDNDIKQVEYIYPIIFAIEHLAFILEQTVYEKRDHHFLDDYEIGLYLTTYENICKRIELNAKPRIINLPAIRQFPMITDELMVLQNTIGRKRI